MKIIIVGCGNVGRTLTEQLSYEGHDITVIDQNADKVQYIVNRNDVMGLVGSGVSRNSLLEAGISGADLMIAVTGSDERNLLCCLMAKKVGGCQTIARVRDPLYFNEVSNFKDDLGLSLAINPEYTAAREISRLLRFPSAIKVESFAKGKVELLQYKIPEGSILDGCLIRDLQGTVKASILVCAIERGKDVFIPGGMFIMKAGDLISLVGSIKEVNSFFKNIGLGLGKIRNVMVVGGGMTIYYLAKQLANNNIKVKVIENNYERCKELSEQLPDAEIICGDGTEKSLLMEEGILDEQAFVSWTNNDEENVMLSMYIKGIKEIKTIAKVNRMSYSEILDGLDAGSIIYPRSLTADGIIQYVRAMQNSLGSNVETMYRIIGDRVEALEFSVKEKSQVVGIPLHELHLKKNLLICSINRRGNIITPGGNDVIQIGDTVIVVTTDTGFNDISDILIS